MDKDREDFWSLYIFLREGMKLAIDELYEYPTALFDETSKLLREAHPKAYLLGERIAGKRENFGRYDGGHLNQDLQRLSVLSDGIRQGEVSKPQALHRANLYAQHLVGVANSGWLAAIDNNALLYWEMGDNEDHCADCPQLEQQSPHRAADIPTMPGLLGTACGVFCHCTVRTADGRESLSLIGEIQ